MKIREKKAAKESAKELQNQENGGKAKKGKKRKKEMDREQRLLRTLLMKESQRANKNRKIFFSF